jgi:PAS domain S-box-containing protein
MHIGRIGGPGMWRADTSAALFLCASSLAAALLPLWHVPPWAQVALSTLTICAAIAVAGLFAGCLRGLGKKTSGEVSDVAGLRLRDFEEVSTDWLWETDAGLGLSYVSAKLAEELGLPRDQLIGKRLSEISGFPAHVRPWQAFLTALTDHCPVAALKVPFSRNGERRWWELTAKPLFGPAGEFLGFRGAGRDVTEAHKATADLLQAKEAAERALNAKSQFLNVMSHELRTPLNAIIGFSEIMAAEREGPLGSGSYSEYSRSIAESSRQLQRIINDIIDASRIDSTAFKLNEQEVDASELVQVALSNSRQLAAQNGVTLTGDYKQIQTELRGDPARLKQILENLLSNAIKFTPANGTVHLKLQEEPDGAMAFIIRDTGIGMEQKVLEKVFEPFVQVDVGMSRKFGGTGLGLPIARKLAHAHGGTIVLESSLGAGTTATFRLPPDRVIRNGADQTIAQGNAAA